MDTALSDSTDMEFSSSIDISQSKSGEKRKERNDSTEMLKEAKISHPQQMKMSNVSNNFELATLEEQKESSESVARLTSQEVSAKANKAANHKRDSEVPSYSVFEYEPLNVTIQQSDQPQRRDPDLRPPFPPPLSKTCRRTDCLPHSHGNCTCISEHEGPVMVESLSRIDQYRSFREHLKHVLIEEPDSDGLSPSPETPETREEPMLLHENEGELVDVVRVKDLKKPEKLRMQHSSAILAPNLALNQPLPSTNGNAPQQNTSAKDLDKEGKSLWGGHKRYLGQLGGSLPDFGNLQETAAISPTAYKMRNLGAPRPVNTLLSGGQSSTGSVGRNGGITKHFDFGTSNGDWHKDKKQRIEGSQIRNGSSAANSIDLETSDTAPSQRSRGQDRTGYHGQEHKTSRRSTQQITNTLDGQVSRQRALQERATDKPNRNSRKREDHKKYGGSDTQSMRSKSSSSSNASADALGGFRPMYDLQPRPSELPLEDDDDPISLDPDGEDVLANTIDPKSKSRRLEVQLPGRAEFKTSAIPKSNTNGSMSRLEGRSTGEISEYFPSKGEGLRRASVHSSAGLQSLSFSRPGARPNTTQVDRLRSSNAQYDEEVVESLMEYDDADPPKIFKTKVRKEQSSSDILAANSKESKTRASRALDSASGHAARNDSVSNPKIRQGHKVFQFQVLRLISESKLWLSGEEPEPFKLEADLENGALNFFDFEGSEVLLINAKSINKIQRNGNGEKLFFSRNRQDTGHNLICMEIDENEKNLSFIEMLTKDRTIKSFVVDDDRMEKIFQTNLKRIHDLSAKNRHRESKAKSEVDFLQAKRQNKELRGLAANTYQASTKRTTRTGTVEDSEDELALESSRKGLSKRMKRRDSSSSIEETESRGRLSSNIQPTEFYSKNRSSSGPAPVNTRGTRASARKNSPTSATKSQIREQSPIPERWTHVNRGWETEWRSSVIYPREGKKKATVDMQDIERLDEGEFLNDNLIVFYLRWLEHRLEQEKPELAKRIYFHNTFFFTSLTKGAKGRGINYEAVERWTSKIDLLSYDYIIVPVNESTHWYVMIICNAPRLLAPKFEELSVSDDGKEQGYHAQSPGSSPAPKMIEDAMCIDDVSKAGQHHELGDEEKPSKVLATGTLSGMEEAEATPKLNADMSDNDVEMTDIALSGTTNEAKQSEARATPVRKGKKKPVPPPQKKHDPKEFRIIALDSLGTNRGVTSGKLRDYIIAEIKAKHNRDISIASPFSMKATTLPQQNNFYDCGVFLLEYIEKFLERPDEFIRGLMHREVADDVHWRPQSEMRTHIRDLVLQLQREQASLEKTQKPKEKKLKRKLEKPPAAMPIISQPSSKSPESEGANMQLPSTTQPSAGERATAAESVNIVEGKRDGEITIGDEPRNISSNHKMSTSQAARSPIKSKFNGIFEGFSEVGDRTANSVSQPIKPAKFGRTISDAVEVNDSPPRKKSKKTDAEIPLPTALKSNKSKLERASFESSTAMHSPDSPATLLNQTEDSLCRPKSRSGSILISDDETEKTMVPKHHTTSKPPIKIPNEIFPSDWAPEDQLQSEAARARDPQGKKSPAKSHATMSSAKSSVLEASDFGDQASDDAFVDNNTRDLREDIHENPSLITHHMEQLSDLDSDGIRGFLEEPSDDKKRGESSDSKPSSTKPAEPVRHKSDRVLSSPRRSESIVLSSSPSTPNKVTPASRSPRATPLSVTQRRNSSHKATQPVRQQKSNSSLRDGADKHIIGGRNNSHSY